MSIIGNPIMAGASGPAASIFVTGLSETDTVTATKGSKMVHGKWVTKTKTVTNSPLIPAMTSDTEPSGVASVTKVYSDNLAYRAFDGDDSTYAYGSTNALPWTLQYEFPQSVSINSFSYRVSTSSGDDNSRTSTHNVEVSLDGSTWETIWSGQTSRGGNNPESGTITLAETKTIKYIRWVNTAVTGSANPSEQVFSLQVYGDVEVQVSGFEISPIRSLGTWTVTATDGVHTKTQDVLVDVITEYEVEISYKTYLYKEGDECEDVTGGWVDKANNSSYGYFKKQSNYLEMGCSSTAYYYEMGVSKNIDISGYTKAYVDLQFFSGSYSLESYSRGMFRIGGKSTGFSYGSHSGSDHQNLSTNRTVLELDISSATETHLSTQSIVNLGANGQIKVYRIWLE